MLLTSSLWLRLPQRVATAAMSLGSGWSEVWRGRRGRSFLWLSSPLSPSSVCWYWWEYSSTGGTNRHTHTHTMGRYLPGSISPVCLTEFWCVCVTETVSRPQISTQMTLHHLKSYLLHLHPCCWPQVTHTHAKGFYYKEFRATMLSAH